MIDDLEVNPKRFPKKKGNFSHTRAYRLRYRGVQWRALFILDEEQKIVTVFRLVPRNIAYR